MTTLLPWRDVAIPRKDIADGSFDEAGFAADLGLVAAGQGRPEYRDPRLFYDQTYLTTNLGGVLSELIRRIEGDPAAAGVYRMQTEFGGGKTHTLLAAYHLFRSPEVVRSTACGDQLAESVGLPAFPEARVVVLDGSALLAGTPTAVGDGVEAHTLLGHLAYRLGGAAAHRIVAEQDREMRGSSTVQLADLLRPYTPCLILLDETLEYLNKALAVRTVDGNLAATTLTVIKELCTAIGGVDKTAIVATLTSSRLEDYSEQGTEMFEMLQKIVGRQENVVTPVEGDDIFPILGRRLFDSLGDEESRRAVANTYADHYLELADAVPTEYRESNYRQRLFDAYPFHPELVDLLSDRWGSLSGFQRTRGALRTLGHTVKALYVRNSTAPLIHVGDVELADDGVRGEVLKVTGESYKAALNADIIRADSKAPAEDRRRGAQAEQFGIGKGLATTAFLYSFGPDKVLGASAAQMLLGVTRPGISRGVIEDVRDSLEGLLWYCRLEGGRYRFTTEPNLNKVILEREGAVEDGRVGQIIRETLSVVAPGTETLRVVRRVVESVDLPDEPRLTLGILDLDRRIGTGETPDTHGHARAILEQRGTAGRVYKNSVMLIAGDTAAMLKARQTARTRAALDDVTADKPRLQRFNQEQRDQLAKRLEATKERLPQQVVMAFRHLLMLAPAQGDGSGLRLEDVDLGPAAASARIDKRVLDHLTEADKLLSGTLAPAALLTSKFAVIADDVSAVALEDLRGYFAKLPRLPKLSSADVLRQCVCRGVREGLFGLSLGAQWDAPDAVLRFEVDVLPDEIQFQPGIFLVRANAIKKLIAARPVEPEQGDRSKPPKPPPVGPEKPGHPEPPQSSEISQVRLRLEGVPADKARDVLKVAVFPLSGGGATVTLGLDISAQATTDGISRSTLDLTVLEGLRQLGLQPDVTIDP